MGQSPSCVNLPFYLADSQYWGKVERPVGLDNVYHFTLGQYGLPKGLKGRWESEEAFVIHCTFMGDTGRL